MEQEMPPEPAQDKGINKTLSLAASSQVDGRTGMLPTLW